MACQQYYFFPTGSPIARTKVEDVIKFEVDKKLERVAITWDMQARSRKFLLGKKNKLSLR